MKKKLIQILMLLVSAVSVGSFVSCKDTNEDLYNELRTQVISEDASLKDALELQKKQLEDLIQKYKDLLANLPKACECDKAGMEADIAQLQSDVAGLKTAINGLDLTTASADIANLKSAVALLEQALNGKVDNADFTSLSASFTSEIAGIKNLITLLQTALNGKVEQATFDAIINGLTQQIQTIESGLKTLQDQNLLGLINTNKALQDGLELRIQNLENALASLNSCTCDYTGKFTDYDGKFIDIFARLTAAEKEIILNKAWVDEQLADINGDVAAAQTAADNATTLANTANTNAQLALTTAQAAQQAADNAQTDATNAQQAAQAAQAAADLAYALAAQALSTANKANDLAVTVNGLVAGLTGRVDANERNIAQLQQDARDLLKLINDNKDKLQEKIDKVKDDLEKKIDDLKSEIQNDMNELKSDLQGDISNLDNKLDEKVADLISKITEVNNTVIANTKDIQKNAENIKTNADNIKANAEAISEINKQLSAFDTRITLATDKANDAYQEAVNAKEKAEANEQSIAELRVLVNVNKTNIENLEKTADELKDAIKTLQEKMDQVTTNTANIQALQNAVGEVKDTVKDLIDKYDELKDQYALLKADLEAAKQECKANYNAALAYVDTQFAVLKAAVIQQIADELNNYYDKDAINAILAGYAKASDLNDVASQTDLNNISNDFYNKILQLYQDMTAGDQAIGDKIYELAQRVAANEQHLDDIDKVLQTMDDKFKDYVPRETLIAWYKLLVAKIEAAAGSGTNIDIDALRDQLVVIFTDKFNELKDDWKSEITSEITADLTDNILPDVITNILKGDEYKTIINQLIQDQLDAADFAQALTDLGDLKLRVTALENDRVKIADYNVDKSNIWSAIGSANTEIGKLKTSVGEIAGKIPTMESDINTLKTDMANAQTKLGELETKVNKIKSDVEAIQSYLSGLVTGITIQGTHNPMFGTFNIPVNIQSNILVAYYGNPKEAGKLGKTKFPTCESDDQAENYVRPEEVLTDADWNMLSLTGVKDQINQNVGVTLVNKQMGTGANAKAYAGKVYMTINPTSVDVSGLKLSIVNSQDEPSVFNLEGLKKSNATLQFGYSRADNGFYEADAYVLRNDLDGVDRPFNKEALKNLAAEAKEQFKAIAAGELAAGSTGLDKLATQIYDVVRSLRLEQSGLKCAYTSADGTEQAIYSQYNLAATALKPLDLAWGKDFNYVTMPGYERVEGFFNRISSTLKSKFHTVLSEVTGGVNDIVNGINVESIVLKDLRPDNPITGEKGTIAKFEITLGSSLTLNGVEYSLNFPVDYNVPILFDKNVTVNGSAVNVPSDLVFDENDPDNVNTMALVITGNVTTTDVSTRLVFSADRIGGVTKKYIWYDLQSNEFGASLGTDNVLTVDSKSVAKFAATGTGYGITTMIDPMVISLSRVISFSGVSPTIKLEFSYDLTNEMAEIWGNSQDAVNNVKKLLEDLIADINSYLAKINNYESKFGDMVDSYLGTDGKLHQYLDKINSVVVNFVNGINWQLGPFMVAEDNGGFKVLSVFKEQATEMTKNNLRIYPTSKTMELLCPFARKHVGVTNVFKGSLSAQGGDADCLNKLKAANNYGDLNAVIDGTERMIEVGGGMESGYIYELAYSVLDFEGNIATRKCYIKIK